MSVKVRVSNVKVRGSQRYVGLAAVLTVAHRSLDEDQLEAAAGRRSEGLLGIVADVGLPQTATGRGEW